MRIKTAAKRAASSPPVPARISKIALRSSASSLGRSASCILCSRLGIFPRTTSSSFSINSFISASMCSSLISASKSASSSLARNNSSAIFVLGTSSAYSLESIAKSPLVPMDIKDSSSSLLFSILRI